VGNLEKQRADAEELAVLVDKRGTTPRRMSRGDEDRILEQVLPIAGEFLPRHDVGLDGLAFAVPEHDSITDFGLGCVTELYRGQAEATERLYQPKPVS